MGAEGSKGGGCGGGGGGAGFLLAGALANAAAREANRPDPEEFQRNPQRAMFQHMAMGGSPVDLMMNLAQAARANQAQQSSGGGSSSTSGQSNSGSSNQRAARSRQNSPAATRRTRRRSATFDDPSSETNEDLNDIRDIAYHFVRRLTRYVRLGGIGQYVTEQTDIYRHDVFYEGTSEYQDRSCRIPGHHAAHVVRVRINANIELEYPEIYEVLRDFVGHTHFVPQYANVWRGLGGEIDRIQARFLQEISTIDFRGDLTPRVEDILRRLKQAFLDAFEAAVRSGRYSAQQVRELNEVIEAIRGLTIRELFGKGRDGLNYVPFSM